jgi:hypothetical protein
MLKLPSNDMKKGMSILLAAFFVVSLTAVAASAQHDGYDGRGGYGGWGYDGCGGWGLPLIAYGGCGWGGYPWGIGLSLGHSYLYDGWGYY